MRAQFSFTIVVIEETEVWKHFFLTVIFNLLCLEAGFAITNFSLSFPSLLLSPLLFLSLSPPSLQHTLFQVLYSISSVDLVSFYLICYKLPYRLVHALIYWGDKNWELMWPEKSVIKRVWGLEMRNTALKGNNWFIILSSSSPHG